jgi:hypothetical protein
MREGTHIIDTWILMKRAIALSLLLWLAAAPGWAQSPPAGLRAALDQAVLAVNRADAAALQPLSAGDPRAQYRWVFRPGAGSEGRGGAQRRWRADALRMPGDASGEWYAVFWRVHACESTGDHVHRLARSGSAWKIAGEIPETETFGFRIRDHEIAVEFDLPRHLARFVDQVRVQRAQQEAAPLQMRISSEFHVASMTCGGSRVPFAQVGGVVCAAPPPGREFTLRMEYQGTPDRPAGTEQGNFVASSELSMTAYWYPTIARLPATNTVTATVPRGWLAISQGNLVARSDLAESSRFRYRMDVPNCYFTLDAGPYYVYQRTVNGRNYRIWLLKPEAERAEKQLGMMDDSFRLFEKLWGPYPFDHYTIVESQQAGSFGALEAYTFTTYGPGLMPDPDPHEWAHNWWGGFVPCTYLQDIWNESFASYAESVYTRYGNAETAPAAAREQVFWRRPFPGAERMTASVPLSESADALYGPSAAVGYGKGALVMQNLEETLGFETLMRCMRAFREGLPPGEAATWADFERVVNRVSGRDMRWWFDQWVRRKGLPRLRWENVTSRRDGDHYEVAGDLVQEGDSYRLRVPVWLLAEGGEVAKTVVEVSGGRTAVRLSCRAAPQKLVLDPEIRLPRAIAPEEMPAPGRGGGQKTIIVTDAANRAAAERLTRFGGERTVRDEAEAAEADLQGANLILLGSPQTNRVWARLSARCPFQVGMGEIRFKGRAYPGARGIAVTPDPSVPGRWITWDTSGGHRGLPPGPVTAAVFDADGRLLEAETGISRAGPGVFEFGKAD